MVSQQTLYGVQEFLDGVASACYLHSAHNPSMVKLMTEY